MELFQSDIRKLNPKVPVLNLSAISGEGMEAWIDWLKAQRQCVGNA
jgi:hydrogenase nickel incorporation protein HypB